MQICGLVLQVTQIMCSMPCSHDSYSIMTASTCFLGPCVVTVPANSVQTTVPDSFTQHQEPGTSLRNHG
ncbi:Uncharacterised protein [Segatella copri]|nr:Uncharacterised protein [Segatella copri]